MEVLDTDLMTLQEAADTVGCHYQTLYRRVRSGEIPTLMAGGSYRIRRTDLADWLASREVTKGAVPLRGQRDWSHQSEQLGAALLTGNTDAARQQVDRILGGGATFAEFCDLLFAPVLFGIGERWRAGELAIADEHRASRAVESLLERVAAARSKPGPRLGTVVVAAPDGDRHSLPVQMVASGLRAEGFVVHYLGADLPAEEILAMAEREQVDLVALSCCISEREGLVTTLDLLNAAGYPTIVGGSGIGSAEALSLGATRYGGSIGEAQTIARDFMRARNAV